MSTALAILPRVWAVFEPTPESRFERLRKQPHTLSLVELIKPAQPLPIRPLPLPKPELAFYRKHTEALLERYMKLSFEAARVPSPMGREVFRGEVSHCRVTGFDDAVHFVHDVGTCLKTLPPGHQHLVQRIALQGYTSTETAAMLGICLHTVIRKYVQALDRLTAIFLERDLFELDLKEETS